ncbi:MAG: glycosyltransferase family 2 protein [Phocaeicola sp.]
MNQTPKISIIVPVYKVEQYLPKCIESILSQTFTDFELLLINDGSPDNCGAICDEYAAKDSRIRVFHKENGGVSSARNLGLKNARGEWITFIDSDDTVEKEYIKRLINAATEDIQFVIQGFCVKYPTHTLEQSFPYAEINKSQFSELFNRYQIYRFGFTVCKLYKRELLKQHNIQFDESLTFKEDLLLMLRYLKQVKKIKLIPEIGYNYFIRGNSLSTKLHPFSQEYLCFNKIREELNSLSDLVSLEEATKDDLKKMNSSQLLRVLLSLYNDSAQVGYTETKKQLKNILLIHRDLLLYNTNNYSTSFLKVCQFLIIQKSDFLFHILLYFRAKHLEKTQKTLVCSRCQPTLYTSDF